MNIYDTLGTPRWCAYCAGSKEENGKLICAEKSGRFYGNPVDNVLCTPCMQPRDDESNSYSGSD